MKTASLQIDLCAIKIATLLTCAAVLILLLPAAHAKDLKVSIPKRSHLTRVQRLNREGVEAVNKHEYEKAKSLFYQAYLFDPGDPFTLNNLGYIAELDGDAERAQKFYAMASASPTDAVIDRASSRKLEGESLQAAITEVHDVPVQVNRSNVEAVRLISEGRVREADTLLHRTLSLDPHNEFTLNNLGVVEEAQGEYGEALKYYSQVADSRAKDPVVVTTSSAWRGRSLSDMAHESEARLEKRMKSHQSDEAEAALFNARGVSALNRNDTQDAWHNFSEAYKLNPRNAFSLNNQGYMSEVIGDFESAQVFYEDAEAADGAHDRVGLATRSSAEGQRVLAVVQDSDSQVGDVIEARSEEKRRHPAPIELKRRDGTTVTEPQPEQNPPSEAAPQSGPPPESTPPPEPNPPEGSSPQGPQ